MKYIIIERRIGTLKIHEPFIFPNNGAHLLIFNAIRSMDGYGKAKVISAGEFHSLSKKCSGRSNTLGVESRRTDTSFIAAFDYTGGFQ